MNREPLRPVSDEDVETYVRDGVVCLRDVFDKDWINTLLPVAKRIVLDQEDFGLLPHRKNRYMARRIEEFRELALNSPLGEVCGRTMKSKEIRFYYDEIFAKPPNSSTKTVWHNDRGGWPVRGEMVPSFWMPLTPITKANCLEVIAESHRNDVTYWNLTPNARRMIQPDNRENVPDGEEVRNDSSYRFLNWDMEPGDVLLLHPWVLHYSSGNPSDEWRIAISARVFGDDIVWDPRPESVNFSGCSFDDMVPGEKPQGSIVPLIWSEDGRSESTDQYPRGFVTGWSADASSKLEIENKRLLSYEADVKARGGPSKMPAVGEQLTSD